MTKTYGKLFALLLIGCILLTSCTGGTGAPGASSAPSASVTDRGQFPIVTEDLTLDIAMVVNATVEDIDSNHASKWLEDVSGINLNFTHLPSDETATKINLMFASDEVPDIFAGSNMSKAAVEEYAAAGWIAPIDDYIAEYGVGYDELMADLGDLRDIFLNYVTLSDGKRYSLNYVSTVSTNMYYGNAWMYMPWVYQLGLETPTTLDEFFDYCMAVKTGDPNGNGIADEVPISGSADYFPRVISFIGNAFQYTDFTWYSKVDNGVVSFVADNDQYKATVEYIKSCMITACWMEIT
jgi:putative aldouronate transport system substrate-binding protein